MLEERAALGDRADVAARHPGKADEVRGRLQPTPSRKIVLTGEPRGRLDRRHIVDRVRRLAVRLVQIRLLGGREVVRKVRDGAPVQLERLAATRHGARGLRARQRRPVRLRPKAGALEMDAGVDVGGALDQPAELADPRMEPAQLRGRDDAVQRVAKQLMTEVVEALIEEVERVQERLLDQLPQRRVELLERAVQAPRRRPPG